MLILTDSDRLRLDLEQLGQRILETAGNGDGGTEIDVELGKLFRTERAGGVHGSAGLGDNHIAQVCPTLVLLPDELDGHLFRLAAGGSVADGDVFHAVFADQRGKLLDGLVLLPFAVGGIDDSGVQNTTRAVDYGHLTAHAIPGVKAHGDFALDGRLHQERAQVQRKLADGAFARLLGELGADLAFQRREEQPVIGVERRGTDELHRGGTRHDYGAIDRTHRRVVVQQDRDPQHLFLLSAVDGENLVPLQAGEILCEVVIELVD